MSSTKQEALTGMKWSSIERFSVQLINFVLGIILARLLTPADFGTVGMIAIFIAVSQTFVDSGFGNALLRKLDRTEVDFSTVFYFNIVVAIICYLILFFISPWVATFLHTPILKSILRVQSVVLILNALMQIQMTKLTIDINFKAIAIRSFLSTLISGICGIILAYCGFGVWALVFQGVLQAAINVIFIWIYCKWLPLWTFSWKSFQDLFSYGSKLLAASLLNTVVNNLTPLVISRYFSAKDLGYYSRGSQFAKLPVDTANGIVSKVTFPVLVKLQNDEEHLIRSYRKYIAMMSMIIMFGCILIAALSKPLILFLLTEKWHSAIIFSQIIAFSLMFDHVNSINLNLLQIKGRSDLFLKLEIYKKTISVAILFASIPFGVLGICISRVIYTQIALIFNTYYTGKLFHLGYFAQVADFAIFILYSLISCTPAFLLTFTSLHPFICLLLGCASALILYYLLLKKNSTFLEMKEIALDFIKKKKTTI